MAPNNPPPPVSPSIRWVPTCSSFVMALLLAFFLQINFFSPISPADPLHFPSSSFPTNYKLQEVSKIGEGFLKDPEDLCVDEESGTLYTPTRDGWVKRLRPNGSWEDWKNIHSSTLLGLAITPKGEIVVCDSEKGLLKVDEDGFSVIASHVNGSKISFADDVIAAEDGSLYFSVGSTKFGLHNWYLDLLEGKPHGQVLKYDPSSNHTSILIDNLYFANGVALSKDQDYLLICETWKSRVLKYWLKGEKAGKTEIFVDNLPGGPDNINLAPDGSFWIGLLQLTTDGLEFVHRFKASRHLVATLPKLADLVKGVKSKARVVKVDADGKIVEFFEDPNGKVMSFVTTALEFENHLYLGSLNSNFIGKLPLRN